MKKLDKPILGLESNKHFPCDQVKNRDVDCSGEAPADAILDELNQIAWLIAEK